MKNVAIPICFLLFVFSSSCQSNHKRLPNIIMILADDLGYGDLGCYNERSLVPTPNLDKMASEGVRLTNAYCPVSVCSPSRYALMTGRYPWRSWRKTGAMRNYERSMIESSTLTLAEMMQQSGYATAGFGKWHLGSTFQTLDGNDPAGYKKFRADDNGANLDLSKPVLDGPTDHGFDHWLGFSCASEIWIFEDRHIFVAIGHDLYTIEATPNKDHIQVIPLADYLPFISKKNIAISGTADGKGQTILSLFCALCAAHTPGCK
jgi:arylsulfatase A